MMPSCREYAKLHREAFSGFFLSKLGVGFLTTLYRIYEKSENALVLEMRQQDDLLSGVAVVLLVPDFYARLPLRDRLALGCRGGMGAVLCPVASLKRFGSLFKAFSGASKPKQAISTSADRAAELVSICVGEQYRGQGIGGELIQIVEEAMLARGITLLSLTTDANHDNRALDFYKKLGYHFEQSESVGGQSRSRLLKKLK